MDAKLTVHPHFTPAGEDRTRHGSTLGKVVREMARQAPGKRPRGILGLVDRAIPNDIGNYSAIERAYLEALAP